jgi:ubiquitin-protein ligase E3 C
MLPLFGDDRRKNINLGGSNSVLSQAAILDQAKVRRLEREEIKKQQQSAVKIQSWWRGISVGRRVRRELRFVAEQAIRENGNGKIDLGGLRSVVLIGDERVLALWAGVVAVNVDGGHAFQLYFNMH